MKRAVLIIPVLLVLLAGCGRQHTPTPKHHQKNGATAVSHCTPANESMGCVLQTVPAAPSTLQFVRSEFGVDFGWSGISASYAKRLGAHFGASYLSGTSKDWTPWLVNSYHAAGLATVAVWETTATRAAEGYQAGVDDAYAANHEALELGDRTGVIDFAIDCECFNVLPKIAQYFAGVHHVLGYRGEAYGGYYELAYLHARRLIGSRNFQTYAWSYGHWLPASIAPLEQYLLGPSFDLDRAIAADFGQWPYTPPPSRPVNDCFGPHGRPWHPITAHCRPIVQKHAWYVSRRDHWHHVWTHTSRAKHPRVWKHARFWFIARRGDAYKLWRSHHGGAR